MSPTEFQVSVTQPELRVTVKQPEVLVTTAPSPEVLVVTANNIGLPGPPGPKGDSGVGSSGSQLTSLSGYKLLMNDSLTPVVSEGIGHSVAQAQDAGSVHCFMVNGDPASIVSKLGSDGMAVYNPGPLQKIAFALQQPVVGMSWCPGTDSMTTSDDDKIYGLPGAAIWEFRLTSGSHKYRVSLRAYSVPGVPDVLYFELQISPDWTENTSGDIFSGQPIKICVISETQSQREEATSGYDETLDGLGINGLGVQTGLASYTFLRCLTHESTQHIYTASTENHYDFYGGSLPGSPIDNWTTTNEQTYRAQLAIESLPRSGESRIISRFVLGLGYNSVEARLAVRSAPNISMAEAVRRHTNKLVRYPELQNATNLEQKAWAYHINTLQFNTLTTSDLFAGLDWMANNGVYSELPSNGRTRWNGLWTHDTSLGLLGSVHVNPGMILDTLKYFFDYRMNQTTGFLYCVRAAPTNVQMGAFLFAKVLRRYLAHTGDLASAIELYPKLKLMWTWWTVNSSSAYRHPNWPTVKLFTTAIDIETQETSPVTSNGNYPSGDDWATAWAYDFCVHMAELSIATGNISDTETWTTWAVDLRAAINTYCWDEGQGWYQPTMTAISPSGGQSDNLGRFQEVMTYRAFSHLESGTATPARAEIMHTKIMDPAIFRGTYGIRTADVRWVGYNPNNWVNGGSRPYYDAGVSVGFRRYGYDDDADTVLAMWCNIQNIKGTTPESTNPETGLGGYSRHLLTGNRLMEAYLAKCQPEMLYDIGTTQVTS